MNDNALLDELRRMWEQADPPPDGLIERMVAATAAVDLDLELLALVSASHELVGARTATSGEDTTSKLEFSNGDVTVLLLVGQARDGARRLDGWIAPVQDATVRLVVEGVRGEQTAQTEQGRFVFDAVDPGMARLVLALPPGDDAPAHAFATPAFEI
jgi:hypothetical protein